MNFVRRIIIKLVCIPIILCSISAYSMDIFLAIYNRDVDGIQEFLEKGGNPNLKDLDGETLLHLACKNGYAEKVKALIRGGADIEAGDEKGNTALTFACLWGHVAVVELLLIAGANKEAKDQLFGWTPLHNACRKGNAAIVERLIRAGADITVKADRGNTPLHVACIYSHESAVEHLLKAGADTNIKNNNQQTAYDVAGTPAIKGLIKKYAQKTALTFLCGILARLGYNSPVQQLGFDHMTKFIVQQAFGEYRTKKEGEKEPELL